MYMLRRIHSYICEKCGKGNNVSGSRNPMNSVVFEEAVPSAGNRKRFDTILTTKCTFLYADSHETKYFGSASCWYSADIARELFRNCRLSTSMQPDCAFNKLTNKSVVCSDEKVKHCEGVPEVYLLSSATLKMQLNSHGAASIWYCTIYHYSVACCPQFDIEGVMYLGKTKVSWNEDLTKPWNSKRLLLSATLCNAAWDALQRDPLLRYVGKGTCILEYVHQGDFGILHMRLPLYEVQSYGVDQTEEGFGDKVKKLFEKYKPTGEQYYFGKGIRINERVRQPVDFRMITISCDANSPIRQPMCEKRSVVDPEGLIHESGQCSCFRIWFRYNVIKGLEDEPVECEYEHAYYPPRESSTVGILRIHPIFTSRYFGVD
ncbi:hypothetical protein CLF_103074 [Clonorchis sinensis]|uniref:Uncharacterized protein n=1 Tax=Clonorchis sinensis TaxID=79923 RepID=G7Y908_CLOSI|nr:hypothetical protein CLF_103074 [Clonorchis sinensis]